MKKIIGLILVLALTLSIAGTLSACGYADALTEKHTCCCCGEETSVFVVKGDQYYCTYCAISGPFFHGH